jgi:MarR family transcriptional regulator for hemolysin
MDTVDPYESIGFHCSLTYRAFSRALENRLQGLGIRPSQFFALSHLMALGPMPQGELAAYLSTSSVAVVKIIDRLERDGWVVRTPSPEDRRVKHVFLTEKAKTIWKDLTILARSVIDQAHQGISDKEITKLKRLLGKIRKNLEK